MCLEKRKKRYKIKSYVIYRDTVMLLIWTAKPPIAVVIHNRENAKSYENQFWLMWKNATTL